MDTASSCRRRRVSATGLFNQGHFYQATSLNNPSSRSRPSRSAKRRSTRPRPQTLYKGTIPSVRRGIIRDFQKSVEETRHRILDDAVAAIANTKRNFTLGLGKTILQYKAISDQLQGERNRLFLSVNQPSALRCNRHQGENEQDSILVSNFLKGHYDIVNWEQMTLQTHLDEWAKIQSDIAGLAVGVLGKDRGSSPGYDPAGCCGQIAPSAFDRSISDAWSQRANTRIEGLARETQKRLASQEKKWQTDKAKRREQMLLLAKQMIDCL